LKEFDVIVIGGGMVGLAFAIELNQKKNFQLQSLNRILVAHQLASRFIHVSVQLHRPQRHT